MTLQDYVTISEGAALVGMSGGHVRRLVKAGIVAGRKLGRDWLIERAALLAYVEAQQSLGNQKHNPWRAGLVKQGRGRRGRGRGAQ